MGRELNMSGTVRHETVFCDPDALVEPVRIVRDFRRQSDVDEREPYVFPQCLQKPEKADILELD